MSSTARRIYSPNGHRSSRDAEVESSNPRADRVRSRQSEAGPSTHQKDRDRSRHSSARPPDQDKGHSRSQYDRSGPLSRKADGVSSRRHSTARTSSGQEGKADRDMLERAGQTLHKQLSRIVELAVQSKFAAECKGDTRGALDNIRNAYEMMREWADRVFEELHGNGRNPRRRHHRGDKDKRSLASFGKMAGLGFRLAWAKGEKKDKLRLDILQELYGVLLAHMSDAKHEMRRLEYKLGLRERKKHGSHKVSQSLAVACC